VDTDSIIISHTFERTDLTKSKIAYSKYTIKRLITPTLFGLRKGSQSHDFQLFNSYDYINAWFPVFLYQNDQFKHSWFLHFHRQPKFNNPTVWFFKWWHLFAPERNWLYLETSSTSHF